MKNTKIETFTDTWNPIQGCLNKCRYCYADNLAKRFGGHRSLAYYMCQEGAFETGELHVLDVPMRDEVTKEAEAYPFGFDPTFCRFRLKMPAEIKRPGNIFVSSMGDMFGPWIPDSWIDEVLTAALETPRHNFCFLTKFPDRYNSLPSVPDNFLFGATIDTNERLLNTLAVTTPAIRFLSIEPLLERIEIEHYFTHAAKVPEWIIVGSETGRVPGHIDAQYDWVRDILEVCQAHNVPLYMKNGFKTKSGSTYMRELMGDEFVQQYHPTLLKQIDKNTGSASGTQVDGGKTNEQ